ncbi:hypothetical protein CBR_g8367 [Chara braunii]|uniref:Protein kinase domain-containing protein n=1 Tax=Chara braunii TaxID=69332 RepID=A0A388KM51_CHABU|nr:hypothetical protein CBR_g8367 [Chara braunii]|eukprot:GBG71068.1 hypothetical protein CBR_g8367 [Chara braunii]
MGVLGAHSPRQGELSILEGPLSALSQLRQETWMLISTPPRRRQKAQQLVQSILVKGSQLDRGFQFWFKSLAIYSSYKVCQLRAAMTRDLAEKDRLWEMQHEVAADNLYNMCVDLGGFFLKSGQFLAKPDMVPAAWVKRLSRLHDQAPATPFSAVKEIVETELGANMNLLFDSFCEEPLGSASIAQVHKAKLPSNGADVAVKVQHPGAYELMMHDLRNHRRFAAFLQKWELPFDLLSVLRELESQVKNEFDFVKEANAMNQIAASLENSTALRFPSHGDNFPKTGSSRRGARTPSPVIVPRSFPGMISRKVLVMEFIDGIQIMRLREEMEKRGIAFEGLAGRQAKRHILKDLTAAYGLMILRDGYFHADPHPGNIFICNGGKVRTQKK